MCHFLLCVCSDAGVTDTHANTACSALTSVTCGQTYTNTHTRARRSATYTLLAGVDAGVLVSVYRLVSGETGSPESPSSMCKQTLEKGTHTSPHPACFLCVCVTVTSRGDGKKKRKKRNELSSSRVLVAAATAAAAQLCRHLRA